MGLNSISWGHYDTTNKPGLPCPITPVDQYTGAQLWSEELGIQVQAPPRATVLILSACVKHGNTPMGPDDVRFSITQYAVGGIWAWAPYGFKPLPKKAVDRERLHKAANVSPGSQLEAQLTLLSRHNKLNTNCE
ncbi:unnamed protein product [Peniophora sp. CBMAI 1063]|nr:unnamed protein product [Peniophora sp. CBMAI 1063]